MARQAGLKEGDLIAAIEGQAVASVDDLHRFLSENPVERPVTLTMNQQEARRTG